MTSPTLAAAVDLCTLLYHALEPLGIYPALTGGQLYKPGPRKDIDIVLYTNRQASTGIDWAVLGEYLQREVGLEMGRSYGFVTKARWRGFDVDLFNPELSKSDDQAAYDTWRAHR